MYLYGESTILRRSLENQLSIASKSRIKVQISLLKEKKNPLLVKTLLSKKDRSSVSCLTAQIWSLETTLRK